MATNYQKISKKLRPPLLSSISSSDRVNFSSSYTNLSGGHLPTFTNYSSDRFIRSTSQSSEDEHTEAHEAFDIEDITTTAKKNLVWNCEMENILIGVLSDEISNGQKISGSFTSSAYRSVARKVSQKFGVLCQSSQVINRLKTVKQNFAVMHDIMTSTSGFGFSQSTEMIEALPSVWDCYLAKKPEARKYRVQPARNYEKLLAIFGKDRATGSRAAGPKERKRRLLERNNLHDDENESNFGPRVDSNCSDDNINLENNSVDPTQDTSSTDAQPPALNTSAHKNKRNKKVNELVLEELRSIGAGMSDAAAALNRGNANIIDNEALFGEIAKNEGLSSRTRMKIYRALSKDVAVARAFLGCPVLERPLWLEDEFGTILHEGDLQ